MHIFRDHIGTSVLSSSKSQQSAAASSNATGKKDDDAVAEAGLHLCGRDQKVLLQENVSLCSAGCDPIAAIVRFGFSQTY